MKSGMVVLEDMTYVFKKSNDLLFYVIGGRHVNDVRCFRFTLFYSSNFNNILSLFRLLLLLAHDVQYFG